MKTQNAGEGKEGTGRTSLYKIELDSQKRSLVDQCLVTGGSLCSLILVVTVVPFWSLEPSYILQCSLRIMSSS